MCTTNPQPKKKKLMTEQQRLLKEFGCKLCGKVLSAPLSTPCGHTFCKVCKCMPTCPEARGRVC